jgi:hypothetical protein
MNAFKEAGGWPGLTLSLELFPRRPIDNSALALPFCLPRHLILLLPLSPSSLPDFSPFSQYFTRIL